MPLDYYCECVHHADLPGRAQFDYRTPPPALAELLAEEGLAVHLGFDGLAFDDVPLGEWAETPAHL